jgi:hypothetical protein
MDTSGMTTCSQSKADTTIVINNNISHNQSAFQVYSEMNSVLRNPCFRASDISKDISTNNPDTPFVNNNAANVVPWLFGIWIFKKWVSVNVPYSTWQLGLNRPFKDLLTRVSQYAVFNCEKGCAWSQLNGVITYILNGDFLYRHAIRIHMEPVLPTTI